MKRKMYFAALSLFSAVCLSAMTPSAHAQAQGKRIAYLTATTSNPFIAKLAETIESEANANGMKITVMTSVYDAALQNQQVNDVIAQRFDALVITPVSERAIIPALTMANRAKIPVFVVNSPVADGHENLYESFIGEDHAVLGRLTGEALAEALKDRQNPKIALITGSMVEGVAPRRVQGFNEALKAHPEIEVVASEDAKWDTATSERIAGQLFARFSARGGLDGIFAMADNMAHGTIQAARAAGIPLGTDKGELVVVSSNCMKFGIDNIRAGLQYSTATQMPTRTGKATIATVVDYFNGKSVPKNNFLEMVAITKENVDKYAEACTF